MIEPTIPIVDLVRLRQHLKGLLGVVEILLGRYDPVCRTCFYRHGLTDSCDCKKTAVDVIKQKAY